LEYPYETDADTYAGKYFKNGFRFSKLYEIGRPGGELTPFPSLRHIAKSAQPNRFERETQTLAGMARD
jgi:hypothetical protein